MGEAIQIVMIVLIAVAIGLWTITLTTMLKTIDRISDTADRIEKAAAIVATNLAMAQTAVDGVATNLAESQERADQIRHGEPGAAADAGSQSGNV